LVIVVNPLCALEKDIFDLFGLSKPGFPPIYFELQNDRLLDNSQ